MSERLRPRDLAFLELETPTAPRHNATVEVFDPGDSPVCGGGFDYDRFVALILDRIPFVPRYRQRVQAVPGHLATPVWVDDEHFDIGYHVRRSALPRPGNTEQLRELVSRIVSRPLDRAPAAVGDLLRRGARRRPGRAALQDPPGARRRRRDRRPRPGAARQGPRGEDPRRRRVAPAPAPLERRAAGQRAPRQPHRRATRRSTRSGRPSGRQLRTADRLTSGAGKVLAGLTGRGPDRGNALSGELSQQRRDGRCRDHARRLPHHPRRPRRHHQRRHPGHAHRCAAGLADDPLRVDGRAAPHPGDGAGLGHRPRARGHLARQPDRATLRDPPDRRGQPGGPAAPGLLLLPDLQGHRPRRSPPTGSPASPASRPRPSTRSARGSPPRRRAAASSSRSPTCPARSRRSTPPAPGCCAPSRSRRCCRARRSRSA